MAGKKTAEFMIVNRRSGKALQATGLDNGLVVEQREPVKADAQIWTSVEAEGGIKLFNKACGKVLDVMQGGTADGTWAQTWEDVGGESQLWQLVNVSSTYKKIVNVHSGKALDIVDMSDEDGAPAQIWESVDGEGQQWKFVSTAPKAATKTVRKPAAKKAAQEKPAAKGSRSAKAAAAKEETALKAEPAKTMKKQEESPKALKKQEEAPKTLTKAEPAPKKAPRKATKE